MDYKLYEIPFDKVRDDYEEHKNKHIKNKSKDCDIISDIWFSELKSYYKDCLSQINKSNTNVRIIYGIIY